MNFVTVILGDPEQLYLLASDAGYGFVTKLADLYSKNRSGKTVLKIPQGAQILTPRLVTAYEQQLIVVTSNEGRMLVFPIKDLPQLPRGKGNKILAISPAKIASHTEFVTDIIVINANSAITLYAGKRKLLMKPSDLANYHGERGRRGQKLPRGFERVERIEVG